MKCWAILQFVIINMFISSSDLLANTSSDSNENIVFRVSQKVHEVVVQLFDKGFVANIWQRKQGEMVLPPIPKIHQDAKSTDIYQTSVAIEKNDYDRDKNISASEKEKYNYLFVNEVFKVTRQTRPDSNELTSWMNALSQGATREGIYRSIVLDNTYLGLENFNYPVNDGVVKFSIKYMNKFFSLAISESKIRDWNFYSLKKEFAEKTLEIVDAYQQQKDIYAWYSIFSSDVATGFNKCFIANTLRANVSPEAHYDWAKQVSLQQLKGELVIKVHIVYNCILAQKNLD